MSRNKWVLISVLVLGSGWTGLLPYHGFLWNDLLGRYSNNPDIAQTVFIVGHFILLLLSSFFVTVSNARNTTFAAIASTLVLSVLMWYIPATQAYYITFALIGATTGVYYAGFCIMFVYSFNSGVRVKVTALYLFGMYLTIYGLSHLMGIFRSDIRFCLLSLLLIIVLFLLIKLNTDEMVSPDSIPQRPFPIKLIIFLSFALLLGYFNSGLIVTNVYNFYGSTHLEHSSLWPEQIFLLCAYLLFYFWGSKANRFVTLYFSLIFIGITYLFCIIFNSTSSATAVASVISSAFFHLFTFSFVADISLKYGRNLKILRISILVVAAGAIFGELTGKTAHYLMNDNHTLLFSSSLVILLLSLLVVPWLSKLIMEEMDEFSENSTNTTYPSAGKPSSSNLHSILTVFNESLKDKNKLTVRELEVAGFLINRIDYDTIAQKLSISKNTLKVHVKRVYLKLHVTCRKELIEFLESVEVKKG